MNRNGIKKVGTLYGKPLVEGDPNLVRGSEILVNKEDKYITLAARNKQGEISTVSNVSTVAKQFANVGLFMNATTMEYIVRSTYTPTSLEEVFRPVPNIIYTNNSDTITFTIAEIAEVLSDLFGFINTLDLDVNVWTDRESLKEKIRESYILEGKPQSNHNNIPTAGFATFWPAFIGFKQGILQGASSIIGDEGGTRMVEVSSLSLNNSNSKGEKIEDTFDILGVGTPGNLPNITIDDSYILACKPLLFISPFVNGVFVLAALQGTTNLVLVNCMSMDTGFMREELGVPESMVIPCKEGEYVKYQGKVEEQITRGRNSLSDSNNILIESLQAMLKALTKGTSTEAATE